MIELYLDAQPDGFLGAEADGALVGVVCAVRYPAFAFVGSMGVRAEHRGRGIGRRLLTRLLDDLERAGWLLARPEATDAGYPLYVSAGFADEFETGVYRRDPRSQKNSSGDGAARPGQRDVRRGRRKGAGSHGDGALGLGATGRD